MFFLNKGISNKSLEFIGQQLFGSVLNFPGFGIGMIIEPSFRIQRLRLDSTSSTILPFFRYFVTSPQRILGIEIAHNHKLSWKLFNQFCKFQRLKLIVLRNIDRTKSNSFVKRKTNCKWLKVYLAMKISVVYYYGIASRDSFTLSRTVIHYAIFNIYLSVSFKCISSKHNISE